MIPIPTMEEGDILAHPFTRQPEGFVSEGEVHPIVFEAIKRGVRVDVGHGSHVNFAVAKKVLDAGIRPFTLGADLHGYNVRVPQPGHREEECAANPFFGIAPFNLTVAMTELLSLGMEIEDIVATTTTANPARMLRMEDEIGTLKPGLAADVSVIEIEHGCFRLFDNSGVEVIADRSIRPRFCLKDGVRFDAHSPLVPDAVAA